jgi:preprotein translocase subunit YajC
MSILSFLGLSDAHAATTHAAAGTASHGGFSWTTLLLPVLLIVVFYFLLIRPQSKRQKEQRSMIDKMMVGDEVMTAGGIVGKIVKLRDNYIVVKIAKEVEITIQKSSIATVLPKGTLDSID